MRGGSSNLGSEGAHQKLGRTPVSSWTHGDEKKVLETGPLTRSMRSGEEVYQSRYRKLEESEVPKDGDAYHRIGGVKVESETGEDPSFFLDTKS